MIKRLLILNGLATVCAVTNHAIVWELTAMFWWTDRYMPPGTFNMEEQFMSWRFFSVRVIDQFVFAAVFAFLFVSGFFIAVAAGRQQKTVPWKLVFQRVKFLLIPYLLWTAVVMVLNVLEGQTYTLWEIAKTILLGGSSPPYYYVILIIQLYILSPLLVPLARDRWKALLLVTGLIQVIIIAVYYVGVLNADPPQLKPLLNILRDWHLLGYAFWFVLGAVVGFHLQVLRPRLVRLKWFFLTVTLVTFVAGFLEWSFVRQLSGRDWISPQVIFINRIYILFLLLTFVAFENMPIPFSSLFGKLGPKSYGIYLIHVIPLELTARLIYHVAPKLLAYQAFFMPLLVFAGVGVPYLMMEVVDRSLIRQYYKYIFG